MIQSDLKTTAVGTSTANAPLNRVVNEEYIYKKNLVMCTLELENGDWSVGYSVWVPEDNIEESEKKELHAIMAYERAYKSLHESGKYLII